MHTRTHTHIIISLRIVQRARTHTHTHWHRTIPGTWWRPAVLLLVPSNTSTQFIIIIIITTQKQIIFSESSPNMNGCWERGDDNLRLCFRITEVYWQLNTDTNAVMRGFQNFVYYTWMVLFYLHI